MKLDIEQLLATAENVWRAGDLQQASTLYESVLNHQPRSASALYGLGVIHMQQKKARKALPFLALASEIEPHAVDIALNHATCLAHLHKKQPALEQLQRAAKFCQDDPVFCPAIADLLLALQEPDAALQLLARLSTPSLDDQMMRARALGQTGHWQQAVNLLSRLCDQHPEMPEIANELAIAAARLRDYPAAITAFEKYLNLVQASAHDYLRFADLQLLAQDPENCNQAIEQAIALGEDGAEIHVLKARVARLYANYEQAHANLDAALERVPNHGQAWSLRAELSTPQQLEKYGPALDNVFEQSSQFNQLDHHHQSLLYYALHKIEHRKKNFAKAAHALRKANQIQFNELLKTKNVYDPAERERQTDALITSFNTSTLARSDYPGTELAHVQSDNISQKVTPIFIVGMPRSGTTLAERILGQSGRVQNGGEQDAMEFVAAEYRQKIVSGEILNLDDTSNTDWQELRLHYLAKLPEISRPMFTDKLPHNFMHVGLILKLFPDAKIIQMHRTIQDVCFSIYSHAFAPGHNYATRLPDVIHFYNQAERLMSHWSSLNSPQILDLKYEDLVKEPEKYAKQLVEFCGLSWNDKYLDFHQSVSQSFTFSEMQVREPISTARINRWRHYADYFPELANIDAAS